MIKFLFGLYIGSVVRLLLKYNLISASLALRWWEIFRKIRDSKFKNEVM